MRIAGNLMQNWRVLSEGMVEANVTVLNVVGLSAERIKK
jgi:hypothetical protein